MEQALNACASVNYRSIAIPAIGCGRRSFSTDTVVPHLIQVCIDYLRSNPESVLQEVKFVIKRRDNFNRVSE